MYSRFVATTALSHTIIDLEGTVPSPSSIFSHAMHHRRTASDTATAMLSRPSVELKEGPSSSHSSRSATPLISTLLRQSQETSPPKALAPLQPLLPLSLQLPLQTQAQQQQKHQQATEVQWRHAYVYMCVLLYGY